MKQPLHVVGTALAAGACLFFLIAMATTGWLTSSIFEYGIFRFCVKRGSSSVCYTLDPSGAETVVRFTIVLAFLLSLIAMIVSIVHLVKFVLKDIENLKLPLIAFVELLVAGILGLLGVIIFAAKVKADINKVYKADIGYSFGLAIVAALMALAAAALIFVQRGKQGSQQ